MREELLLISWSCRQKSGARSQEQEAEVRRQKLGGRRQEQEAGLVSTLLGNDSVFIFQFGCFCFHLSYQR